MLICGGVSPKTKKKKRKREKKKKERKRKKGVSMRKELKFIFNTKFIYNNKNDIYKYLIYLPD